MMNTAHPLRASAALVGAVGVAALAGCSATPGITAPAEPRDYVDGSYTASGSYSTPESIEQISVTVTLEGGVVTTVDVVGDPQTGDSARFQNMFIGGIAELVVGKPIDEISVRRVAGSSLTSGGFGQALGAIRQQATR